MALIDELSDYVSDVFRKKWDIEEGDVVPEPESVNLSNQAVELKKATVLYADISGSTQLVDDYKWEFAAEVYKSFLYCAAKVITSESGTITAYDGDRIMAVFLGGLKNSNAATSSLKINFCVEHIINPLLKKYYRDGTYKVQHVVGIDTSELHVARTGVRGANDLVWVGRAANYAAKLSSTSACYPTLISEDVYEKLADFAKYYDGECMWEKLSWPPVGNMAIYGSSWLSRV